MTLRRPQPASLIALWTLTAVVAATWLGEHAGGLSGLVVAALVAFTLALLSAVALWRSGRGRAVTVVLMTLVAFALPWMAGSREASLAFNECVDGGERVRQALDQYRAEHHRYPARLSELPVPLPGQLALPPHLLKYQRTGAGYRLSFSDWLVTYSASDRQAFLAQK